MKIKYIYVSILLIFNVIFANIFYFKHKKRLLLKEETLANIYYTGQFEDIIYFNFVQKEKEELPPND